MVKSIYLAEVLFTNQISSKVRPVLILKQNSFGDLIYMPISTNMLNKGIEISNLDFDSGNIPQMTFKSIIFISLFIIVISVLVYSYDDSKVIG